MAVVQQEMRAQARRGLGLMGEIRDPPLVDDPCRRGSAVVWRNRHDVFLSHPRPNGRGRARPPDSNNRRRPKATRAATCRSIAMDIRSGSAYPAAALSNFTPHPFVLDGIACASMEGLLQSLKFDKPHIQVEVCKLVGRAAKARGAARNAAWRRAQTLWWQGKAMGRDSAEYQAFLDRAYRAMAEQSESFRKALLATGDAVITHSIGKRREAETVLTEREFCSRLMRLRAELRADGAL
jgi:predicted NAD-dependent protein-ADP-ribosyltransferase YbiA (DUF1768 family)